MKRHAPFVFLLVGLMLLFLTACSEKSTEETSNPDVGAANVLARQGFDLMNAEIQRLQNTEPEMNSESLMPQQTYNNIKAKFDDALVKDPSNPMANLGLAVLDFVGVNYDNEFWNLYTDMDSLGGRKNLLKNQIGFFANSPTILFKSFNLAKSDPVSILRFQNYVTGNVLPKLETAKSHLINAVAMADSNAIFIDTGEENVEIDRGEIYAFKASVELMIAAMNIMTAYNWDMVDSNNSYNWITEINNIQGHEYHENEAFDYTVANDILTVRMWDYDFNDAEQLSAEMMFKTVKYNLDHNPSFATIANNGRLATAKSNLQDALADAQHGVDYILAETDSQTNDIIKIENILDLNTDINNHDEDEPPFMQNWHNVTDIITWMQGLLSGTYTTTVNNVSFSINLSAYFNGALDDLRDVQPYIHWNDTNTSWVVTNMDYDYSFPSDSYGFMYNGQWIYPTGTYHTVHIMKYEKNFDVGYFTDPQGNEIGDNEPPYFPDYTFKGLFPGMTREKLIQLTE